MSRRAGPAFGLCFGTASRRLARRDASLPKGRRWRWSSLVALCGIVLGLAVPIAVAAPAPADTGVPAARSSVATKASWPPTPSGADAGRAAGAKHGTRTAGGPATDRRVTPRSAATSRTRRPAAPVRTADIGPAAIAGPAAVPRARSATGTAGLRLVGDRVANGQGGGDYLQRPDVLDYIDTLVATEGFDRDTLLQVFGDARYSATAARLMAPPPSSGARRDWNAYRARFVEPVRLSAGFQFWDDNAALLDRAEREFGVPAEIIVGILGVETVYGRNTGGFRVVDALTTLAFDYPRGSDATRQRDRSTFFRDQLTEALRIGRDGGADLSSLRGSYAGAIGMPQFMPGSIRQFAIDYDGDGRIDLVGSPADIIGSVANFLARHGWVRDLRAHLPLTAVGDLDPVSRARLDAMVEAGSVPTFTYADFTAAGLTTSATPVEPLALIDLPSGVDAAGRPLVTYIAGTQNFHVITRYNRSYFYAFSVIELGSTIRALRDVRR